MKVELRYIVSIFQNTCVHDVWYSILNLTFSSCKRMKLSTKLFIKLVIKINDARSEWLPDKNMPVTSMLIADQFGLS